MKSNSPEAIEVEQYRQQLLQQLSADSGEGAGTDYSPGSFGCHELLDRTALILALFEQQVVEHPACFQKPQWFALANEAVGVLSRLYQAVGGEHLK
jgi:hypothetical protein